MAGRGLLILGPSGAGKSTLALDLIGRGCDLVADDQVALAPVGGAVMAQAPAALAGRIEARGVGILNAPAMGPVALALVVDLGRAEDQRLPPRRDHDVLGISLPLVLGPLTPHLGAALRQYLVAGRAW